MASTQVSYSPNPRRQAAVELLVVLLGALVVRLVLHNEFARGWLPAMPVVQRAWVLFLFTIAVLLWLLRRHRGKAHLFGLKPFAPWPRVLLTGVLGTVLALVVDGVAGPIIRAMLGEPNMHHFGSIKGNLPVYLLMIVVAVLFGGLGEELLYRGIIFTRLRVLFGEGRGALAGALLAQGALFGLVHSYQGASGMVSIGIIGVIDGLLFVVAGSNLWAPALSHALIDILGFTLLYLGAMKT